MDEQWFNVNEDARIWAGHAGNAQKQGWLRAPAAILAIDEYKGSYQFKQVLFDESLGGADERKDNPSYPQYWIRIEDVSLEPYPTPGTDPDPGPVTGDAQLGAAFRIIINFIASRFRS